MTIFNLNASYNEETGKMVFVRFVRGVSFGDAEDKEYIDDKDVLELEKVIAKIIGKEKEKEKP